MQRESSALFALGFRLEGSSFDLSRFFNPFQKPICQTLVSLSQTHMATAAVSELRRRRSRPHPFPKPYACARVDDESSVASASIDGMKPQQPRFEGQSSGSGSGSGRSRNNSAAASSAPPYSCERSSSSSSSRNHHTRQPRPLASTASSTTATSGLGRNRDDEKDEFLAQQRRILEQIKLDQYAAPMSTTASATLPSTTVVASLPWSSSSPQSPRRRSDNDDMSETSFSGDLLHDEAFVRERRRLWATIREGGGGLSGGGGGGGYGSWETSTTTPPNQSIAHGSAQIEQDRKPPVIAEDLLDRKPAAKPSPSPKDLSTDAKPAQTGLAAFRDDCTASLPNGMTLRLKGTKHVYDSLQQGTCAVVRCHHCQALLQVPQSSSAVYCPLCHRVTPMEVALRGATAADSALGAVANLSLSPSSTPSVPAATITATTTTTTTTTNSPTRKRRFARLIGRRTS